MGLVDRSLNPVAAADTCESGCSLTRPVAANRCGGLACGPRQVLDGWVPLRQQLGDVSKPLSDQHRLLTLRVGDRQHQLCRSHRNHRVEHTFDFIRSLRHNPWKQRKETRASAPFPSSTYIAPGGLRQDPGDGAQSLVQATTRRKRHVTNRDYEDELQAEQTYVTGLYTRLDAERARVKGSYSAALRGPIDVQNGGTLVERDAEVRALAREAKRLDVADNGLCFGRLDALSGERSYIGRIGIFDKDERVRTAVARLAGAGGARVLRRHRRQPGGHAPAPPVPHARAPPRRLHRRDPRSSRRCSSEATAPSPRTRRCSRRSTRRGATACATSSRRSRPNRTRSSGWIIPGCW